MDNSDAPTQAPPPPANPQPQHGVQNTPSIMIGMPGHPPPQPLLAVEPIEDLSSLSRGFVVLTLLDPIRNVDRLAALRLPILAAVESVHRLQQQLSAASDAQLELVAECVGRFYRRGCVLTNIGDDNRRTAQRPHGTLLVFVRPEPSLQNPNTSQAALNAAGLGQTPLQVGIVTPLATQLATEAAREGPLMGIGVWTDPRRGTARQPSPGYIGHNLSRARGNPYNRGSDRSRGRGHGLGRGYGYTPDVNDAFGSGLGHGNHNADVYGDGEYAVGHRGGFGHGRGRGYDRRSRGGYGSGM